MANVHQPHMGQHVTGWTGGIWFAGLLMAVSGVLHLAFGLGGVLGTDWYLYANGTAWLFDSSTWGWTMIVIGSLLLLSVSLLMAGNMLGRIMTALLAIASVVANVAMLPITPVWSSIAIVVAAMIFYAVVAHGDEMKYLER